MRSDDFFLDDFISPGRHLDTQLLNRVSGAPLPDRDDIEVALPLARLIHDDLEKYGTAGGEELSEEEIRVALRALLQAADRLGVDGFEVPFREFGTFRSWWIRNDARGSWQARRDLRYDIFEPLHERLAVLEQKSLVSSLADPISPRPRTGWPGVDAEISELRRHFQAARTPQDYRAVGLDCVAVTEALSGVVYDPTNHLRPGEEEPPIDKTKRRLDRYIEDSLPGPESAAIRKVARAVIELAQEVKHSSTPTRREAGIAADSVIQLANILRRLAETE